MAKYQGITKKEKELEISYATKEEFFIKEVEAFSFEKLSISYTLNAIAKDDDGYYYTNKDYVGSNLLDPNRMYHRKEPDNVLIEEIEKGFELILG